MHDTSCMVTLTYDDDHLPTFGQLHRSHLTKFLKRLRKNSGPFRYVASGEYGDHTRRPHFHIALFGMDFAADRVRVGTSSNGEFRYSSAELRRSWSLGNNDIGSLNFESAAYIARYILKKIKGPGASPLPLHVDPDTGEVVFPHPEFLAMSKGIGKSWFRDFFMTDVYPHACVITPQGSKAPVPRYYKTLLKEVGTDLAFNMSARTIGKVYENLPRAILENDPRRKVARNTVALAKAKSSKRFI